jgi:sulfite reductase alpha subunit-like flavoprotein
MARLKSSFELCPEGCGFRLIQFAVKLPFGLGFRTGWRALILPRNPMTEVSAVASVFSLDLDQPFRIRASQNLPDMYVPDQVTSRHLFEQYIDLSAAPTRPLAQLFAGVVDQLAQEKWNAIIDDDFAEFANGRTVLDFIQEYAPHGIP